MGHEHVTHQNTPCGRWDHGRTCHIGTRLEIGVAVVRPTNSDPFPPPFLSFHVGSVGIPTSIWRFDVQTPDVPRLSFSRSSTVETYLLARVCTVRNH